jgi:hypothetical protein
MPTANTSLNNHGVPTAPDRSHTRMMRRKTLGHVELAPPEAATAAKMEQDQLNFVSRHPDFQVNETLSQSPSLADLTLETEPLQGRKRAMSYIPSYMKRRSSYRGDVEHEIKYILRCIHTHSIDIYLSEQLFIV